VPRLPYCPPDLAEPHELVSAIRARRAGTLLNLDRMLLHSPPFAAGGRQYRAVLGVATYNMVSRYLVALGIEVE
jgi:hypothetical protein